jgi:hypothetical protein
MEGEEVAIKSIEEIKVFGITLSYNKKEEHTN